MYQQIINYIQDIALRHKAVKSTKYQSRVLINAQNNNGYVEVVIEDNPYFQSLITQNIFTLTLNIDVLAFPKDDTEVLDKQNVCFQVMNEIIAYIGQDTTFLGQLSIHDYDYYGISHFTDDDSCGFRLSLELVIPDPINLCTYKDNFDEEVEIEEKELDLVSDNYKPSDEGQTLDLKPIRLKTIKK